MISVYVPAAQMVSSAVFPYHRCSDYASTSLPYVLSSPVDTPGDPGMYCMTLTYKGDVSNPSDCYDVLSNQGGTSLIMGVSESSNAHHTI